MHKILTIALLLAITIQTAQAEVIKASVNGMVCAFCATGIKKTFKVQPAVKDVKVDLDSKLVTIETKKSQTLDDKTITKLITDAGYSVTAIKRSKK